MYKTFIKQDQANITSIDDLQHDTKLLTNLRVLEKTTLEWTDSVTPTSVENSSDMGNEVENSAQQILY